MFVTPPQPASNKISTVPAPTGGLNARDSLAAMPETDAVIMDNWWPQPFGCSLRKGYQEWSTGLVGPVETLAQWSGLDGSQLLFAWAGTDVYDVTNRGAVGAAVLTGLTNALWQFTSMGNAAGSHLIAVNGADDGIVYDETGAHRLVVGDGLAPYTWKNLDPKNAIQVTIHQHRLWAVPIDSAVAFYLPPDAIYGDMQGYDFGPLFPRGGYISFVTTWTMDDGNGAEDHLVVMSSTGTAVVFGGTDPSNDQAWSLVGVYNIGAPVLGRRAYSKVGGDVFILTQQGIVSMAKLLMSTKVNEAADNFASAKVQFLVSELVSKYADYAGWQLMYYPKVNMLLCNIPTTVASGNTQLVSNQIIDAWAQFSNMDAACWGSFASNPFFGTYDGRVMIAWEGGSDGVKLDGTGGEGVTGRCQQAYSYLGALGAQKQVGMFRPNFIVADPIDYNAAVTYDFEVGRLQTPDGFIAPSDSVWNGAKWNEGRWYGGTQPQREWRSAEGLGVAASVNISLRSNGDVLWVSTDFSYISGGLL